MYTLHPIIILYAVCTFILWICDEWILTGFQFCIWRSQNPWIMHPDSLYRQPNKNIFLAIYSFIARTKTCAFVLCTDCSINRHKLKACINIDYKRLNEINWFSVNYLKMIHLHRMLCMSAHTGLHTALRLWYEIFWRRSTQSDWRHRLIPYTPHNAASLFTDSKLNESLCCREWLSINIFHMIHDRYMSFRFF